MPGYGGKVGAPPIVAGGTSLTRPSLKYVVSYVKQNSEQ